MRGPRERGTGWRERGGARFDSVWSAADMAADGRLLIWIVAECVVLVSDSLYSRRFETVQITRYLHKKAAVNVLQYAKQCLRD